MIFFNNLMFQKFKKLLPLNGDKDENKFDIQFIENGGGIFLKYKQKFIEKEKDSDDIPYWEFHVNRLDSDFDELYLGIKCDEKDDIKILKGYYFCEELISKFEQQFSEKTLILRLQYDEEFNLLQIFFHTLVNNDILEKKNVITINLTNDDKLNIASLIITSS